MELTFQVLIPERRCFLVIQSFARPVRTMAPIHGKHHRVSSSVDFDLRQGENIDRMLAKLGQNRNYECSNCRGIGAFTRDLAIDMTRICIAKAHDNARRAKYGMLIHINLTAPTVRDTSATRLACGYTTRPLIRPSLGRHSEPRLSTPSYPPNVPAFRAKRQQRGSFQTVQPRIISPPGGPTPLPAPHRHRVIGTVRLPSASGTHRDGPAMLAPGPGLLTL